MRSQAYYTTQEICEYIKKNELRLNGEVAKADTPIKKGDVITFAKCKQNVR